MCEYRVTDKWHIQINDQEMTLSLPLITPYLNGHDATGGANFKTRPRLFTSREAAWSCRTVGREKIKKGLMDFFVNCSFIICPGLNFFANNNNFKNF